MRPFQQLENGLYVTDMNAGERYSDITRFLIDAPSCRILDNVLTTTGLVLVFCIYDRMNPRALDFYSLSLPIVYRVPTDKPNGLLKTVADYEGLGGGFSWVKMRCPRRSIENVENFVSGDMRIGETLWASEWLYSRIRTPDQYTSQILMEGFNRSIDRSGERHPRASYLHIIEELKRESINLNSSNSPEKILVTRD